MGGWGHGAGVTRFDSVRHADQGEGPSCALNLALQAISPKKERKKNVTKHVGFCCAVSGKRPHTHTLSWRFVRKKLKCDAELFDFFFFHEHHPQQGFFFFFRV